MMTFRGLWLFVLGVLVWQNGKLCRTHAETDNGPSDSLGDEMCATLAKNGRCDDEPRLCAKYCTKTYFEMRRWERKQELLKENRDIQPLKEEDSPTFYELSAVTNEGKTIDFQAFDGYVTIVAFIPKVCDRGVAADETLRTLREIRGTWPMVVEVVAFPFEHPDSHYYDTEQGGIKGDCPTDHYQLAFERASEILDGDKKSALAAIKSMEEVSIDTNDDVHLGRITKQHAVYRYFKDVFSFHSISGSSATVFIVSPDGDFAEVFYDGSLTNVKKSIREQIKQEL